VGLHKAEQFRPDLCSSIELPVAIVEDFIPDGVFRINGFTRGISPESSVRPRATIAFSVMAAVAWH
jgi:hypothetical protein